MTLRIAFIVAVALTATLATGATAQDRTGKGIRATAEEPPTRPDDRGIIWTEQEHI